MQIFIASPWRNKVVVEQLTEKLTALGYGVYSFLQSGDNLLTGIPIDEELVMFHEAMKDWEHDPRIKRIFESELEGLKASDAVILVEPSGHSSLLETGIGYGMGKKVFAIGAPAKPEVFYLVCTQMYTDLDAFLADVANVLPI